MQKVVTIDLNGNAYQLDESAYEALRAYLERADAVLQSNPDRAEIIADLEQAIAEKCQKFLGPQKSVVSAREVDQVLLEMGPVDAPADAAPNGGNGEGKGAGQSRTETAPPKRLFRIMDGGMIAGVCNGLAAYFGVDVTLVRILFVVAAVLTKGIAILGYVVMMFIVPEASTSEERAAAGGMPFNAKAVIDQAMREVEQGKKTWSREWRRMRVEWRHRHRHWRRHKPRASGIAYAPGPWAAALIPIFGIAHLALFVAMMAMLISLVNTGGILDWRLPPEVPLWAAALILLVGYQIVVAPLRVAAHITSYPVSDAAPWFAFWNAVVWLVGLAFALWMASDHTPEIVDFLRRLPDLFREFVRAVGDFFDRV